jgi:hypothetical protein
VNDVTLSESFVTVSETVNLSLTVAKNWPPDPTDAGKKRISNSVPNLKNCLSIAQPALFGEPKNK